MIQAVANRQNQMDIFSKTLLLTEAIQVVTIFNNFYN